MLVKLDDDDEDEGLVMSAPAEDKGPTDTHSTHEAASALERGHINLSVQVSVYICV